MARKTLEERVVTLEQETAALRDPPRQVAELGSQLSQLHAYVRGEFSAIRRENAPREALAALALEVREEFAAIRRETATREALEALALEMRQEFAAVRRETATREALDALALEMRDEFAAVRRETASGIAGLRAEMIAGDAETRRHMRTLHEEVIGRLALIQEGMPRTRRRKSR